jgi:hypothetical protein
MKEKFDINNPAQKAANAAKREKERVKKADYRARNAEQDAIDELLKLEPGEFQAALWARNRAKFTTEELTALEARQDLFIRFAIQVQDVIDGLSSRKIGPPDGLPFPDSLYDECIAGGFVGANEGGKLVFHEMGEGFSNLYRDISCKSSKFITESIDAPWYKFGIYTRFLTDTWGRFVDVVAAYIQAHPDDENLDKNITEKIIAERQKRQPRRPVDTLLSLPELYQRSANEVIRANQEKSGLDPFNQSNYQF